METGRKPGRSQVEVEASVSATESLSARESHEQRPGGNTGAETAPEAATREASGTHGAVETEANPADRKTAREKIANLLWWSVPSSTDEEAKARTEQLLDEHAAEVRAERADLEAAAIHARSALAALCYDLEDPGSNALGALYLLSQATLPVDAPKDDTALALAQHAHAVLHKVADMADPEPPEVSFFGPTFGPQVAAWLRMIADSKAVQP